MAEIKATREGTRAVIEAKVKEFSNETHWGDKPNDKVVQMGKKFCDEMLEYANTLDDMDSVFRMELFAITVCDLVGCTRSYDSYGDEELEAISKTFDVLRDIRTRMIDGVDFGIIFDQIMYAKEIFLTNAAGREDFDCKYRQSMIFPNFVDMYEIVNKIESNWDKLAETDNFLLLFIHFRIKWYYTEISTTEGMSVIVDRIYGRPDTRPGTAIQDRDPRYYAREFLKMLDERING